MNITTHCRERYVERIQNITDNHKIKQIAKDELESIEQKINSIFNVAQLIFEGSLLKGQPKRKFYVSEDIILVTDIESTSLITLYKVDFGFPVNTNRKVLDDLLENINDIDKQLDIDKPENIRNIGVIETDMELLDLEIENCEKMIKLYKGRKASFSQEIHNKNEEIELLELQKDKLCKMVCSSLDYKKDLLSGVR